MNIRILALALLAACLLAAPARAKDNIFIYNLCYEDVRVALNYTPDSGKTYTSVLTGIIAPSQRYQVNDTLGRPAIHTFGRKLDMSISYLKPGGRKQKKRNIRFSINGPLEIPVTVVVNGEIKPVTYKMFGTFGHNMEGDTILPIICPSEVFDTTKSVQDLPPTLPESVSPANTRAQASARAPLPSATNVVVANACHLPITVKVNASAGKDLTWMVGETTKPIEPGSAVSIPAPNGGLLQAATHQPLDFYAESVKKIKGKPRVIWEGKLEVTSNGKKLKMRTMPILPVIDNTDSLLVLNCVDTPR